MPHASHRRPRLRGVLGSTLAVVLGAGGLALLASTPATATPSASGDYWSASSAKPNASRAAGALRVSPKKYAAFTLDDAALRGELRDAPLEEQVGAEAETVYVPAPNGDLVAFEVKESPVMEAELQAANPEIRTYAGRGVDGPTASIRLDVTPIGFHASVRGDGGRRLVRRPGLERRRQPLPLLPRPCPARAPEKGLIEPELDEAHARPGCTGARGRRAALGEAPGADVDLRTYRLALLTDPSYAALLRGTDERAGREGHPDEPGQPDLQRRPGASGCSSINEHRQAQPRHRRQGHRPQRSVRRQRPASPPRDLGRLHRRPARPQPRSSSASSSAPTTTTSATSGSASTAAASPASAWSAAAARPGLHRSPPARR